MAKKDAKQAATNTSNSVKYVRITDRSGSNEEFSELQFRRPPPQVPKKAIFLAVILFVTGTVLIIVGSLLLTDHFDVKYNDRTLPVLLLGIILFIPGAYHVRIAYYAYKGYDGYSYDDIPEFE